MQVIHWFFLMLIQIFMAFDNWIIFTIFTGLIFKGYVNLKYKIFVLLKLVIKLSLLV